jgi:hypothetical protein
MEAGGWPIMSRVLNESLASWREAHGFGILNIISPGGDYFLVESRTSTDPADLQVWVTMSEPQVRQHLAERGFSDPDTDHAIRLSREWATTVTSTGSSVFAAPPESN